MSWPRRTILWGVLAAMLLCPLVAMRFTAEVRWGLADFVAAGALLALLGGVAEVASILPLRHRTRSMVIAAALCAVMLIWADAAVGIF